MTFYTSAVEHYK